MKSLIISVLLVMVYTIGFSQKDSIVDLEPINYKIVKTDGGILIGKILSQDKREMTVLTSDGREIIIPQYIVKELIPIKTTDFNAKGSFVGDDNFSTRYFITTNGLPIKKGEHYVQWNLYGPDLQFGVRDNLGVGIMTSWIGMPIIGTVKYSFQTKKKVQFAVGSLLGTGSWALPNFGLAVPFATASYGSRKANIAISAGYGGIMIDGDTNGRFISSLAGMVKISKNFSLVFDSFILLPAQYKEVTEMRIIYENGTPQPVTVNYRQTQQPMLGVIIPGVRWHTKEGRAFQFGFAGAFRGPEYRKVTFSNSTIENSYYLYNTEYNFIPVPMLQWFRSF